MKSFYKGGSELPTDTGSSYSTHIKSDSKKIELVAILILFRLYFTYIFQGLARYASGFFCEGTGLILKKMSLVASDFLPVNTCLSSAFYSAGSQFSSGFHRASPMKSRCGLEGNPMNGRSWLGIGRVMLCCIAFISMFSLSAQTPRKNSGADGLTPLQIGDKVPEEFWKKEHLFYINGDTIRKTLIEYKGKPLIIDFWATFCQTCIEGFPKLNQLQEKFDDRINILLVNSIITKDDFKRIHQIKDATLRKGNLKTIFKDQYFAQLFPFKAIPQYLWINHKGMIEAVTTGKYLNNNQIEIIATYQVKQ